MFVIIIDGINENTKVDIFSKELESFIEASLLYPFIRIIVSCRIEYFTKNFNNIEFASFKADIATVKHLRTGREEQVAEKLFNTYIDYFEIKYEFFNGDVYNQLVGNFLLLRIYCEVFRKQNVGIVRSIHKEALFQKYYELITEEINKKLHQEFSLDSKFDIRDFFAEVVKKMIAEKEYANIKLDSIIKGNPGFSKVYNAFLDNNVLLKRDLESNNGPFGDIEVVNFTFDEFRDYMISMYLVQVLYNQDKKQFFDFLKSEFEERSVIKEGCTRFLFYISRKKGNEEILQELNKFNWYNAVFSTEIFNIDDSFINADDIDLLKQLIVLPSFNTRIVYGLISRADTEVYKTLNIKLLFEFANEITESQYEKHFLSCFGSEFSGKIKVDSIIERLESIISQPDNKFQERHHNFFELIIYLFPKNYKFQELFERYHYRFKEKAAQKLFRASKTSNDRLVSTIKNFCKNYGISI